MQEKIPVHVEWISKESLLLITSSLEESSILFNWIDELNEQYEEDIPGPFYGDFSSYGNGIEMAVVPEYGGIFRLQLLYSAIIENQYQITKELLEKSITISLVEGKQM